MAITRQELFAELIRILEEDTPEGVTSDPDYYISGEATEGEWANIIKQAFQRTTAGSAEREEFVTALDSAGFFQDTDDLDFWRDQASAENALDIQDLENAAEARLPTILTGADGGDTVQPEGSVDGQGGVLTGGKLVRVSKPEQDDVWVQAYEYPAGSGNFIAYQYDSFEQAATALGTANPEFTTESEQWMNEFVSIGGNAAEVIGVTGTWGQLVEDVKVNAARAAGITDPTILGAYLNDPEIQDVIARSALGGWTDAQQLAELRDTTYYKEVLYPGIENYYGQTSNPEGAYNVFVQNTQANLAALGIPKDADGTYKSTVGQMLDAGVSDTSLATFTPTYLRAAGNDEYRQGLNKWLGASGIGTIDTFDAFFDVIGGNTAPEIQEVVELASLSFYAGQQGLDIIDDTIQELAARTDLSEQAMQQAFSDTDKALLALGDAGLRNYELTQRDILNARANITSSDGRTVSEVNNLIQKASQELAIADDPTAKIFTDFNREGAPVKLGLGSSIAEGA